MRATSLTCLSLVLVLAACRSHKPVAVDTTEAKDIPREVAIQKLNELLPTAEYTVCSHPKATMKMTEIKVWSVRNDAIEIDTGKGKNFVLTYAEITNVRLEQVGRYFVARVFTNSTPDREKDHYQFQWRQEEKAKQAVELLASLAKK